MSSDYSRSVDTARSYYESDDAHLFYVNVWGGEDLHLGIYERPDESIFAASRRTVDRMASFATRLDASSRVLDVGAGFGGSARHLARTFGCQVTAFNLSRVENERSRAMNREQRLDRLIEVVDGNFEDLPFDDGSFDLVWSQDAILHSGDRERVLREVFRVLRGGGEMIFTDPMASDDCPEGVLAPILERIHLETLGSPGYYQRTARQIGFEVLGVEDQTKNLIRHYARVLQETTRRERELIEEVKISAGYIERMKSGLQRWVDGGNAGWLAWCIFHLRKPS